MPKPVVNATHIPVRHIGTVVAEEQLFVVAVHQHFHVAGLEDGKGIGVNAVRRRGRLPIRLDERLKREVGGGDEVVRVRQQDRDAVVRAHGRHGQVGRAAVRETVGRVDAGTYAVAGNVVGDARPLHRRGVLLHSDGADFVRRRVDWRRGRAKPVLGARVERQVVHRVTVDLAEGDEAQELLGRQRLIRDADLVDLAVVAARRVTGVAADLQRAVARMVEGDGPGGHVMRGNSDIVHIRLDLLRPEIERHGQMVPSPVVDARAPRAVSPRLRGP